MMFFKRRSAMTALLLLSFSIAGRCAFSPRPSFQSSCPAISTKPPPLSSSKENGESNDINDDGSFSTESVPRGGGESTMLPRSLPSMPTMAQYRKFALPCLGLWVSGPLLSLVDTSFVGLSGTAGSSATQLAALGPATTFFDGATYLFAFLNVATTNLYASARAQAGEESAKAEGVVRTAVKVACLCGLGLFAFLMVFTRPLLALYIGKETCATPMLLDSAVDYVRIRALSMPTSLLLGVLQSSLLGAKDAVTPLIAVLYATVTNCAGDYLLINKFKMGLRGAAIATTLAQWASTYAIVRPSKKKLLHGRSFFLPGDEAKQLKEKGGTTSRSFLAFAAPVLTLILGKLAAFGFMTHVAAALPGQPTTLASHQIILSLFFFVSPFMEVISQTAQTFLPPFLAPVNDYIAGMKKRDVNYDVNKDDKAKEWISAAYSVATSLFGIGLMSASVVATSASFIPAFFSGMLTSDETVKSAVKPLARYLWAGAFLTAPVAVSEGVLLARRELRYLATVYLVSTALLPSALLRIKHQSGPVVEVWGCFAIFQLFRASCFAGRIWGPGIMKKIGGAIKTIFSSDAETSIKAS